MPSEPPTLSERLSQALRGVRRARRMRAQDVADAMGLPLRSYEYFEGGHGQINLERIYAFAKATGSDGDAIVAAVLVGEPQLAVWAADNKLVLALKIALGEFAEDLGADIARIDTRTLLTAFTQMFKDLAAEAKASKAWTEARLGGAPPEPPSTNESDPDSDPQP
jgi:transcriptional regulator with XRE-family HTH domain